VLAEIVEALLRAAEETIGCFDPGVLGEVNVVSDQVPAGTGAEMD
jgi:hypothetical protein